MVVTQSFAKDHKDAQSMMVFNQEIELMSDHYPVLMQLLIESPITLCDGALAVEGLDFQINSVNDAVELTWSTEREINNEGFEIQHSIDGLDWRVLDFVVGAGNTNQPTDYKLP